MSKITEYQELKAQYEALQLVTDFSLSQVDNGNMGGKDAQFIVSNANPLFVTALVEYVKENSTSLVAAIMAKATTNLGLAQAEAKLEAQSLVDSL